MRLNLRLFDPLSGRTDEVVLTAEPETPIEDVAGVLNAVQPGELFAQGQRLAGEGQLGPSGLRDGDVVTVGSPERPEEDHALLQLAAAGGPMGGRRWPLSAGSIVVGRSDEAAITVDDPTVSREHFRLTLDGVCTIEDLGSTNGTLVDGRHINGPTPIQAGNVIGAGASIFEVRPPPRDGADVRPDGSGGLAFNRPARIRPAPREVKVVLPAPPSEPEPHSFPWVQVIAPLVLAVVVALIFQRPEFLLFALMSPVLAISTTVSARRRDARRSKREEDRYAAELAAAKKRIAEAAAREIIDSRYQFPDPAALWAIATGPSRRLWERREYDPDAMLLRVGLVDRPASMAVTSKGGDGVGDPPRLPAVPVTVDLARAGVLGVAGPTPEVRAATRWLIAQLAVLRSPRDLQLVLLADAEARADWDWVRWLPHTRVDDPRFPLAMVGNDRTTREARVKELLRLLEARTAAARELHETAFTPSFIVVFDGIRALRSLPGVPRLLKEGPAVGICAIGLDSDVNRLAEEGRAQLILGDDPVLATLEVDGAEPVPEVLLDQVDTRWADEVARALAPIRDAGGEEGEAVIPKLVRYVDLAGIDLDRPDEVESRWMLGGRTTEALVGVSLDGPFSLDLKRDGPHALVAGTTGSGKSEFLQTLVASLALANRPDAINFVLIDYKGASAFADCERLPHTVGLVTNLDSHLTERALVSLDAELKRRERVLKDLGAVDIDAAWERNPERAAAAGLARLVIAIDEFAELVHELPEFVTGLIRIARVGRSLGVHLILATQRPAGVVSPEMRANTGLRVAFRMEDKNDSSEVLEAPHAADISRATPGRGFVSTGGRAALVEFQAARVAARRKGATEAIPPPAVDLAPWNRLGYPPPAARRAEEKVSADTDLHTLVELMSEAGSRLGIPPPRSPWLPPLPILFSLPPPAPDHLAGGGMPSVVFGIEDLPAAQTQRPATFDVVGAAHLLIAGSARSGRSTALRTLAGSLARSWSPSDLHLYGLDFGNGALLPLADLPHCGAVVTRSETERVERLIMRLAQEVSRRQEILARAGLGDIGEQRQASPPETRLAYLVVLVDRWEGFTALFPLDSGSELPAAVLRLVREGPGVGLRLVIAGDRSLLTDRIAAQVEDKLVLRLADRNDYRIVGINPRNVPEDVPAGRAVRGESGLEVQFALLDPDPSAQVQATALRRIGQEAEIRWPAASRHNRPFHVDLLPSTISFERAWALAQSQSPTSPMWALVGVGGDELTAFGIDLAIEGGFVVAGPGKTGRSTALVTMAHSLLACGADVVALCPRPSRLQNLEGTAGVRIFSGTPEADQVSEALTGYDGPLAVVMDDAELLARTPVDDAIREFVRASQRGRVAVVVAGQLEEMKTELRGAIVEAKKAKVGLLLSPSSTLDGDLLGLRLPRNLVGRMPPGRGLLALHGEPALVQVPL